MSKKSYLTTRRTSVLFMLVVMAFCGFLTTLSLFSSKPKNLGVTDGKLAACPSSPNCVSTQATDDEHRIEPISFAGSAEEAIRAIKSALETIPRTKIVTESKNYLHAESRSLIFRFTDDVEFYFDSENGLIHFRSASRSGHNDLGANRRRMEKFRAAFDKIRP